MNFNLPWCLMDNRYAYAAQLKLKKNLSVCYILPEVEAWSNVTVTSKLE